MTNAQLNGCKFAGWQCFHCGETFETVGGAQDHFGSTPDSVPGCMIKVQLGQERGLLRKLREVEDELARVQRQLLEEDSQAAKFVQSQSSRFTQQIMEAEELGYSRGLKDYQAVEERANRAEERVKGCVKSLKEMTEAMYKYELDVDEPAPARHREMIRRAESCLNDSEVQS